MEQWLPVLDVAPLLGGESGALETFATNLRKACEGPGFYFLEGFEQLVPEQLCRELLAAAAGAHCLPADAKQYWLLNASDSGYMPIGATTRWGSAGRPTLPEHDGMNEAVLFWGNGPPWVTPERQLQSVLENQFPGEKLLPGFQTTVAAYQAAVEELARALLPAYALALEEAPDFFSGKFDRPCWALRLNHYPPTDGKEVGIPAHADGDFCTLLLQDDQPGLSILRSTDGQWVQAPTRGDFSMLVNSGNHLARLSNGRFPSTMHSASCLACGPDARARQSVAFFWSPSIDVVVEPLPSFVSKECPARYDGKRSGNIYSSGRVGRLAETDPERHDDRADTFQHPSTKE